MNGSRTRSAWMLALAVVMLSALAGFIAYNVGVSHGLAQTVAGQAAQGALVPPYGYPYWRPWGFGFGFPVFLLILAWFVLLRGLFWGGPWRHRYYARPGWVPPAFDEWHRRAHEQMKEGPSADHSDRRG